MRDHISAIFILITSLFALNNLFGLAMAADRNNYAIATTLNLEFVGPGGRLPS